MPPLNSLHTIPVPPPDVTFFDGSGVGNIECAEGILGMDVESVNVVEAPVPGFGDSRASDQK